MTTVEKSVGAYTPEQTEQIQAEYLAGVAVEVIAANVGKTVRSVIAKLSQAKIYKSPAKEVHKREMKKAEMVAVIANKIGVNEEVLESLEKATSPALVAVMNALCKE